MFLGAVPHYIDCYEQRTLWVRNNMPLILGFLMVIRQTLLCGVYFHVEARASLTHILDFKDLVCLDLFET